MPRNKRLVYKRAINKIVYEISDTAMKTETCYDYWYTHIKAIEKLFSDSKVGCGVSFGNSKIAVVCLYKVK